MIPRAQSIIVSPTFTLLELATGRRKAHWISYLTPSVWRLAALTKIVEEIVSDVGGFLRIFPFYVCVVDGSY
jgi:hypothetical protein